MTTPTSELASGLTGLVAARTSAFGRDALTPDVLAMTRRFVLDTVGTTLAAITLAPACRALDGLVNAAGCAPRASVLGTPARTSAALAALVNGARAHALNFDDASEVHLGVTTLPAALAVAQERGGVGGRDLLAAVAAGMELMARLGRCLSTVPFEDEGHPQPTQMPGYFAAAASSALVLGLGTDALRSAFGVALLQAAGARQNLLDGRAAKSVYAGFPAQGGVQAATLAAAGLDADCQAFEGEAGLFDTYYRDGVDTTALTDEWDEPLLLGSTFKPWPTTAAGHPQVRAALRLHQRHVASLDGPSAGVARICLIGHSRAATFAEPLERKQAPSSPIDAEDSVFFPVAKALRYGRVTLDDIHGAGLADPPALALTAAMTFETDPLLGRDDGAVEILFTDGSVVREDHRGVATTPMTYDESAAKFADCVAASGIAIDTDRVVDTIDRLDRLADIESLVAALTPDGPRS